MKSWDLLKGHYENKKLIINSHVSRLLNFPTVTKDKHVTLKQFIMHIRTHSKTLQVLGQPIDQWDTVLIFMTRLSITARMGRRNGTAWTGTHAHHGRVSQILERKMSYLRNVRQLQRKIRDNSERKQKRATSVWCQHQHHRYVYKESHSLFNCLEFLKLPIQDRIAEAKRQQLCINCLKAGHYAKNCRSSKCRKCSKIHNTFVANFVHSNA